MVTAYWSQSQVFRQQQPVAAPEPLLIDDEAQRLINDANLLIHRDRLLLLEIIGQGQSQGDIVKVWKYRLKYYNWMNILSCL